VTLTQQDDGRTLSAHVGDILELHLAENATTGYRWEPDNDDAKVLELAETSSNYRGGTPGSGGEAIFRFRVIATGSGTLSLKYWRHWEGAGSIVKRFRLTIDAAP
jgi:inhibitor of cysteine peptidase